MITMWLLLGLAAAAPYIGVGVWLGDRAWAWWGGGLVVAALAYVGFAADDGVWTHALVELVGVAGFGWAAWAGARARDRFTLALAWALHPVWDLGVHAVGGIPAPAWYVWMCLSFDLGVAAAIVLDGVRRRALHPSARDV